MDIVFSKNGVKCAVFIDSDVQSYIKTYNFIIKKKYKKALKFLITFWYIEVINFNNRGRQTKI